MRILVWGTRSNRLLDAMAAGDCRVCESAGIQQQKNIRLGVLQQTRNTTPLQFRGVIAGITTRLEVSAKDYWTRRATPQQGCSPGPVELPVGAHEAVPGVVYD